MNKVILCEGATDAILLSYYLEKVFNLIDEQIRSVQWEKSKTLRECFGMLVEM